MNIQEEWELYKPKKKTWGRFLRVIFGRTTFVITALLIQLVILCLSFQWLREHVFYLYGGFVGLSAVVVIYIINKNQNPSYQLSWIIPVLVFPVFGALFYLFVETQPGTRAIDRRLKEIIKEIIEFDLDEGRMDYLDDMIDVFSKDGCEMVDILFDRFLKKYYADIDVSNERMTINLTDEEGHVLSFNLSQSEVHYVLHMVERRLNSFMRDDGGGGFSDED